MSTRSVREEDLTPEALEARGQRLVAEGYRLLIRAEVRREVSAHELVDQDHSPLKRRRHIELARTGKIPATKEGRRWLIRRQDLYDYLNRHGVVCGQRATSEEDVEAMIERVMKDEG